MSYGAKLYDLRLFRVLLKGDHISPDLRSTRQGVFLVSFKPFYGGEPLIIYFNMSALFKGNYYNLAQQVIPSFIYSKSRDLLAQQISDYFQTCFSFFSISGADFPYKLVVVLELSYLPGSYEQDYNLDDIDYYKNYYRHSDGDGVPLNMNMDNNTAELAAVDKDDDFRILEAFYNDASNVDSPQFKDVVHEIFVKIKPTIETMQQGELVEWLSRHNSNNTCSICFESISTKMENTRLVRCNHVFHTDCIMKWLPNKHSCPYCRASTSTFIQI